FRQPLKQMRDRLEQPRRVLGARRWPNVVLGELGKETRELGAPGNGDTAQDVVTIEDAAPAKGIDPEPIGQRLLGLVPVAHQRDDPPLPRLATDLPDPP